MLSVNVENMIPKIRAFFADQPVKRAWLFGSCSRGEETDNSDVDILVEYDRSNARISLMTISRMIISLGEILHRNVDIIEDGRVMPFARDNVGKDRIMIYEREC